MSVILSILGLVVFALLAVLWVLINRLFFQIHAKKENQLYQGLLTEYFNFNIKSLLNGDFIEFFPLSLLLKRLGSFDKQKLNQELWFLYRKKYKLELVFWILFIGAILSIPIIEITKEKLLQ